MDAAEPTVHRRRRAPATWWQRAVANLAFQDVVICLFHLYLALRIAFAPDGPEATTARMRAFALLATAVSVIVAVRGELLPPGRARAIIYRLAVFLTMTLSYFELHTLLPALQPRIVDAELYAIDRALLGETPALWFPELNTLHWVEWFSFFYYAYFPVMTVFVLPGLFLARGRVQIELIVGTMIVCVCGHVGYTLVPGSGPLHALAFSEPLHGGLWWGLIMDLVRTAGMPMDVFPSLHTAYPVLFALHSFAHRKHRPYRTLWLPLGFLALNMVLATMFLRWHWAIDVAAGLAVAFAARWIAVRIAARETDRDQEGLQPVWEPIRRATHPAITDRGT